MMIQWTRRFAIAVIALAIIGGCSAPLPRAAETPASTATPPVVESPLPTTTLILPTAAPTRTSGALSSLQVPSIVLSGHSGWIANLAWSPDGKILASVSKDHTVRLWILPASIR